MSGLNHSTSLSDFQWREMGWVKGDFKGTAYLMFCYVKCISKKSKRPYSNSFTKLSFIRSKISFTNKDSLMSEVRSLLKPKKISQNVWTRKCIITSIPLKKSKALNSPFCKSSINHLYQTLITAPHHYFKGSYKLIDFSISICLPVLQVHSTNTHTEKKKKKK